MAAGPSLLARVAAAAAATARALGLTGKPVELGVHGTAVEGAGVSWEERNGAYANWRDLQRAFDEAMIDPVIRGADRLIVNTCLSGSASLRSPDDSPEALAVLRYCEQAVGVGTFEGRARVAGGLKAALRPLLSAYLRGVAVAEKIHEIDPDDGLAWLVRLAFRRQGSLEAFEHDEQTGHLVAVTQEAQTGQPAPQRMPRARLVVVTYDEHLRLTQGLGVLRSALMMRRIKSHTWAQIAVGVERWANSTPKVKVNRLTAKQAGYTEDRLVAETTAAAQNAAAYCSQQGRYLVGSDVVDYETFGEGQFDPTGPLAVIAETDRQVLLAMLVQFLIMGVDGTGSRAIGLVHQNVLQRACSNLLDDVSQRFVEEALRPLVAVNFGPAAAKNLMPILEWVGLDFEPLMAALGTLPALVSTGLLERDRPLLNQLRQGLRVTPRPGDEPVALAPGGAYANPGAPGPGRPEGSYDE